VNDIVKMRAHILMVTHVIPFPPSAGNEIRIFRMLQWFKYKDYRVTLVLKPLMDEIVSDESVSGLRDVVDDLFIYDKKYSSDNYINYPLDGDEAESSVHIADIQDGFCPPWFVNEVGKLVDELSPNVLVSQYIFMSRVLISKADSAMLKVIDTHDVFSRKKDTVEKYGIENFGLIVSVDEEVRLFNRADLLLAIQQNELEEIAKIAPRIRTLLVGFDVDINETDLGQRDACQVLIVASNNEFNVRGTQDFIDITWPLIREKCPHAKLRIVGKVCNHVSTWDRSIDLVGFVPDLRDEYGRASVVINPCGVGTGLKIKTVEALAWGKPHVGWPASADGLRELGELPYIVATDVVEFADAVISLLQNERMALAMAEAAHGFAKQNFGSTAIYGPLSNVIEAHISKFQ